MTNNQLKYIVLTGLFAVPFVPLIVSTSLFFPFITGKAFIFRIIVEIVFAAYLVLAVRDKSYRPKFSWILGSVVLFLGVMAVADVLSQNPFKSFWSNYERMEGYITLLHLGAYFIVLSSVLKTQEIWNKILVTSLGASVIMSIYSFLQIAGKITINQGGVRVDGTLGNAAYLGIYMVFNIFIALLLLFRSKYNWQKIILGFVALADLVILYYTATRGAILGFLGGLVITLLILAWKSKKGEKIRKISLISLGGIVLISGLFLAIKDSSWVKSNYVLSRFASLSTSEIQSQGRYYIWPIAIKGFIEKPILGWGQESFNFVFNKYYDPKMYGQEPWFDRAHNTFLDWLVAGGALGLLSYLSIIFSLVYYLFKAKEDFLKREDKAIILGLVAAYLFNNLFVFDQLPSYLLFFLILAYVHAHTPDVQISIWEKISTKLNNIFERRKLHPIIESGVLIIFIAILYFGTYIPWRQNKDLLNVLSLNAAGQLGAVTDYAKPLSNYDMGFPESLEHISQATISVALDPNAPTDLKSKLFDTVDSAFERQIAKIPNDARYRLFYGVFLSRFGWYGKAIEQLKVARDLSPNKQQIQFELVNNYLLDNKLRDALETAKHAYELEPSYDEAKIIYAYTAIASGDKALGEQLLATANQNDLIFDDRYINILLELKEYDKIIEVAKKRIELQPNNPQNLITLTAAYLQANRREDAVAVLHQMISMDPSFKDKGEFYISEIRAGRNP